MLEYEKKIDNELRKTARFILDTLTEKPAYIEIDSMQDEEEPLKIEKTIDESSFTTYDDHDTKKEETPSVAVIDGGHATIVDGHSFTVAVHRAGYLIYLDGLVTDEYIDPLRIQTYSHVSVDDAFRPLYMKATGHQPEELPHFRQSASRMRELNEWLIAEKLIGDLSSGDFILIDGSLRSSISVPYSLIDRITKKASENDIHLVGVTKTSTLYWGENSPLIPVIHRIGDKSFKDKNWFCRVSDFKEDVTNKRWFGHIYVAKLSPCSNWAFRVDVNRYDKTDPTHVFAALSRISHDPSYMGYPYPLAAVHNMVRIEPSLIEDLRYRLQTFALQEGVGQQDWDMLFSDFHELLDVSD